MTLKLYQLEKDMEIRLSIGRRVKERERKRDRERNKGIVS